MSAHPQSSSKHSPRTAGAYEPREATGLSGIYRFVLAFNKRQLFMLSCSIVLSVAGIFFTGFLIGNKFFKQPNAETAPISDAGVRSPQVIEIRETSGIGGNIGGSDSSNISTQPPLEWSNEDVNKKSSFNTDDLIFENAFLDGEDIELADENGRKTAASKKTKSTPATPSGNIASTQSSNNIVRSSKGSASSTKPAARSLSSQQANNRPAPARQTATQPPAPPVSRLKSVAGLNSLPPKRADLYEGYPQPNVTYYYLQLMTTSDVGKGRRFSDQLRAEGFAVKLVETGIDEAKHYVILVGLYRDRGPADADLRRFRTAPRYGAAFKDAFLRPYKLSPDASTSSAETIPVNANSIATNGASRHSS